MRRAEKTFVSTIKRGVTASLAAMLLFCVASLVTTAQAHAAPQRAYAVIDADSGELLKGRRSTTRLHPASLTKMMTLYLTFEAVEAGDLGLDQKLVASKRAASMPASKLGLKPGDVITVRHAIRAAAVRSSNDAAVVLAEAVAGSEAAFAKLMTSRGRDLGLKSTSFKNATGLTRAGHLSTARDMARLARALYTDFPAYYNIFGRTKARIADRTLYTTNGLLKTYDGADGVKTGYTRKAGFNLAAAAEKDGKRVIAVYFGGKSAKARDQRVAALLDAGFDLAPAPTRNRGNAVASLAPLKTPRPAVNPARPALGVASLQTGDLSRRQIGKARPAVSSVDASWAIQVGAYKNRTAAEARLIAVAARNETVLRAANGLVTLGGTAPRTIFRSRFLGFGEGDARNTCARLRQNGDDCAVVPPDGWRQAAAQ